MIPEVQLFSKKVFEGKLISLRVDDVRLPNGSVGRREVVDHPGAVGIVAVEDGSIILVRQFRYAVGGFLWEIPAGTLNPGEERLECAKRELREETGYSAREWESLLSFYPTPGFASEMTHLFVARGLQPGPQQVDGDEFIRSQAFSFDRVWAMIRQGEIADAKTLLGFMAVATK